ncbi:uncharacterized protein O3C94_013357 [Discoglossus pictus]
MECPYRDCGSCKDNMKQDCIQHRGLQSNRRISHYKDTFIGPRDVHPRSSKRPLRTPALPKLPPMNMATTQRTEFISRPLGERAKPFIPAEGYYQNPQEPVLDQTLYSLHFPPKKAERARETRPPDNLRPPAPSSHPQDTTNRAEFKEWRAERQSQYGELPAQTGSLLFPNDKREMKTTTQEHFVEKKVRRVVPVKAAQSHLILEGEHDMTTTHQFTFQPHPLEKVTGAREPEPKEIRKRPQVPAISKYNSDFPALRYPPERIRAARPPADNLTVNPHYRSNFKTVQRENFPGWDPRLYPRPELAHLNEELTSLERERGGQVDGITVTKLAFQPPDPQPQEPIRRPRTVLRLLNGKFDGSTHSRTVFQDWGVQPCQRYKDSYEGIFLRPLAKLESETTTGSTFVPKKGEPVQRCKPAKDNLELTGERDFNTVNSEAYRAPALLCQ